MGIRSYTSGLIQTLTRASEGFTHEMGGIWLGSVVAEHLAQRCLDEDQCSILNRYEGLRRSPPK
jgi:hypothetical protein